MARLSSRFVLACALPLTISPALWADEADVFNFRAAASVLRDDNLFRVPDSRGQKAREETITATTVGVNFNKQLSLQQFIGQVSLVDTRYQRFDYLNSTALNYDASWLWAIGGHLRGEVAAGRSVVQNAFEDFPGHQERNLRTIENQRFGLDYAFHPSWHVLAGASHLSVSNDKLLTAQSDLESSGVHAGLRYTPVSGNSISGVVKQSDGRYQKRPFDISPGVRFDNRFTDRGVEFGANWRVTGHSVFTGRLEYLEREHAHLSDRNYRGWVGQANYLYEYSGKTTLSATYLRGLTAYQEAISSYYVSDDLILAAKWLATGKVTVNGRVGFSHRQYRGEVVSLAGPRRDEDVTRISLDAAYQAKRWLEVRAGVAREQRESNNVGRDYTDHQVFLSGTALF